MAATHRPGLPPASGRASHLLAGNPCKCDPSAHRKPNCDMLPFLHRDQVLCERFGSPMS